MLSKKKKLNRWKIKTKKIVKNIHKKKNLSEKTVLKYYLEETRRCGKSE